MNRQIRMCCHTLGGGAGEGVQILDEEGEADFLLLICSI